MRSSRLCYLGLLFVVLLLVGTTLACEIPGTTSAPSKPTITITAPTSGSEFQAGEQVSLLSSASDAKGVMRVELYVDGLLYSTDSSPDQRGGVPVAVYQFWLAEVPGTHTLSVIAVNVDGQQSDPWVMTVRVVGDTPGPSLSPTTEGGAPPVPTATYTVTATETVPPPPPTATLPPPTPTLNPDAPLIKYFRANGQDDSYTAVPGEKVVLSWEWERVGAGYLDPGNVALACPAMPCNFDVIPEGTTTYTLRAKNPTATTEKSVTVKVE
jgi:hypothetical protein